MDGLKVEEFLSQGRNVWLIRAIGVVLLVAAWVYFAWPHFGSLRFVADSLAFLGLGAYVFIAGYNSRRHTMTLEKKLRLSLIMRNMELESMATRDHLTHLFNRRHFFERLERELQNAKGFQRPLSVLLIDINAMNEINSEHGHRAGDLVIASFGKFLLDQARASDLPARIGGDEFAVILPDTTEVAAQATINRLFNALEKTTIFESDEVDVKVTVAIGSAGYPWNAETEDELLRKAWASLEQHKRSQNALGSGNGAPAVAKIATGPAPPDAEAPS
jgi:diguanylate cyclase (GGDEF)-like protein